MPFSDLQYEAEYLSISPSRLENTPVFPNVLLPGAAELELEHLDAEPSAIVLTLHPTRSEAPCPLCDQSSAHIHGHYRRTVADRPWAGIPVRLRLRLRKFG